MPSKNRGLVGLLCALAGLSTILTAWTPAEAMTSTTCEPSWKATVSNGSNERSRSGSDCATTSGKLRRSYVAQSGAAPSVARPPFIVAPADRSTRFPFARSRKFPAPSDTGFRFNSRVKDVKQGVRISRSGSVVSDVRIHGDLVIEAYDVTVRNVEVVGGRIENFSTAVCYNGLRLEDTTISRGPGQTTDSGEPAIGSGGYTASNVKIDGTAEGFRVGGRPKCGPVVIVRSWVRVMSPDICRDWHGDAIQGYGGDRLTVRRTVLILEERDDCAGTAPFFYPARQGNASVNIDGLLVRGGGYSFRLGTPGQVKGLRIVEGSWGYAPADVDCRAQVLWEAQIVKVVGANQLQSKAPLAC